MRSIVRGAPAALMVAVCAAPGAMAQPDVYRGLYFHEFTGSFSGTEWSTWGERDGAGRMEFSDLTAEGTFAGTVAGDGGFTLDAGRGTGAFTSDDSAFIDFTLPGLTFRSEMVRAPYTDADFPVFFTESTAGDAGLTGAWQARILDVDPMTGETIAERTETVGVAVDGTTVRVTDADGSWVQGVWLDEGAGAGQAALRVVHPNARLPRYRTFDGSATSEALNLVGDLRVLDDNAMTLAVFFQTRAPVGRQQQTMRYYELTRVPTPGAATALVLGGVWGTRRRR